MSPVIAILVGAVAAQHGIQTDSTLVLREARRLVAAQYDTRNSHFLDEPCEASAFASCMQGDWSCTDVTCPPDLSQRRRRLIEQLDDLASAAGNSAWLYRQRVALAVKNQEPDRAMEIAGTCDGQEWWCMALRGFASHQVRPGTGFESFDSAFVLLQAHPERLQNGEFAWGLGPVARCTWTDVRSVAPAELVDQVLGWGCPSGNALRERFWWLADPLWTQDGNGRYAEHLARHVMIRVDLDVLRAVTEARGGTRIEDWMWNAVDLHEAYGFALRQGFPNSRRRMTNRRPGNESPGIEAPSRM
jgi:hypothetical protein